jgi:hypothetical protein
MKKPRVEDFDPNAAPPLGSPIDNYPKIERSTRAIHPSTASKKSTVSPPTVPPKRLEQQQATLSPSALTEQLRDSTQIQSSRDRSNERTNETTFERTNVRLKIRHTFDIYADQLMSLREIALKREVAFGKRTLLGDLVQEALDHFLTKERNKE